MAIGTVREAFRIYSFYTHLSHLKNKKRNILLPVYAAHEESNVIYLAAMEYSGAMSSNSNSITKLVIL